MYLFWCIHSLGPTDTICHQYYFKWWHGAYNMCQAISLSAQSMLTYCPMHPPELSISSNSNTNAFIDDNAFQKVISKIVAIFSGLNELISTAKTYQHYLLKIWLTFFFIILISWTKWVMTMAQTISRHWFRWWLGAETGHIRTTCRYLKRPQPGPLM